MSVTIHLAKCCATHGLSKTHETVERSRVAGEINTLEQGDTERVLVKSKTSNIDVVGNDIASNGSGSIGDLELVAGVDKRRRRLSAKECVVSLQRS